MGEYEMRSSYYYDNIARAKLRDTRSMAVHKNKAVEQLEEAEEMLAAAWSKMDSLEWKRWAFIMAVRLMSALVNAVLSIQDGQDDE